MPHQCVRCGAFYQDDAKEIMQGCASCNGKLFFYVKPSKEEQAKELVARLEEPAKLELQEQVEDVIGQELDDSGQAVVVDLESITVSSPGKYELNLIQLLDTDKPVIYKLGEGKYVVDLVQTFERFAKKKDPQKK